MTKFEPQNREEYDLLENGVWKLRSILLESDELTESMNNKFVMEGKQKWLRDLLLMLDLALLDKVQNVSRKGLLITDPYILLISRPGM